MFEKSPSLCPLFPRKYSVTSITIVFTALCFSLSIVHVHASTDRNEGNASTMAKMVQEFTRKYVECDQSRFRQWCFQEMSQRLPILTFLYNFETKHQEIQMKQQEIQMKSESHMWAKHQHQHQVQILGINLDKSDGTSVFMAFGALALAVTGSTMQCCASTRPKPLLTLMFHLSVLLFIIIISSLLHASMSAAGLLGAGVFACFLNLAMSVHFTTDDRNINQVWDRNDSTFVPYILLIFCSLAYLALKVVFW